MGGGALQKEVSPISPCHHQLAPDSSEMWAAIMRNSSSPQCQHFPLGALTNLWALEGGRGKDWVPRAGLLRFNKCHCGALCQLHKQAAICVPCILCPFMVHVWEAGWTFFYLKKKNPLCIHTVTFTHRSCPVHYCTAGSAEYPSFPFSIHISRNIWESNWGSC